MSRTEKCLKKIASNLGVKCTADDNVVCEVLNKIGDEMPLIKGERVVKVPLEVGMDLHNKTIYFDTTKTIPVEGESKLINASAPAITIELNRTDGGVVLKLGGHFGINDVIYENGTWYMDSYTIVNNAMSKNIITSIDEEMNEYVYLLEGELGLYEKVENAALYQHFVTLSHYGEINYNVYFSMINNQKNELSLEQMRRPYNSNNSAILCSIDTNSNLYHGILKYHGGYIEHCIEYYTDGVKQTIRINEEEITTHSDIVIKLS